MATALPMATPTLQEFGSRKYPLRSSSLPTLLRCPLRQVLMFQRLIIDESGEPADTGSLMHLAAAHWHKNGDIEGARRAMLAAVDQFPKGNVLDAGKLFSAYAADPRNQSAQFELIEDKIEIELPPWPDDPTQEPIIVTGTLDQVRYNVANGNLEVWDIKTSKKGGVVLVFDYAAQIAAYTFGAEQRLKKPVHPGGIIRVRGYVTKGTDPASRPDGIFFPAMISRSQVPQLLDAVRQKVSMIRQGIVMPTPGEYCSYCPSGGVHNCLPLQERINAETEKGQRESHRSGNGPDGTKRKRGGRRPAKLRGTSPSAG